MRILAPRFKAIKMINVIGTYECKADAKGRVMFPVSLKKQLKNVMGDKVSFVNTVNLTSETF